MKFYLMKYRSQRLIFYRLFRLKIGILKDKSFLLQLPKEETCSYIGAYNNKTVLNLI